MSERAYLGRMYVAKRPCGKVVAMCWDDKGHEKSTGKSVADWIKRGDKVDSIDRYEGDAEPEWACRGKTPCPCREADHG